MTYEEAGDALAGLFWSSFGVASQNLLGYTPKVFWPFESSGDQAPSDKVWLRVTRATISEELAGYGEGEGNIGMANRRYDVTGLYAIQIFCPQVMPNAERKLGQLAMAAKDSLQGKHDPTNFLQCKNVTIKEQPSEKVWYRVNVVCDFEYQEVKNR